MSFTTKMFFKMLFVGLVLATGLAHAMPTEQNVCVKFLVDQGFSNNFNETIAHAIHSMTVQGLQKFNPRATVRNIVPTVNMDRHSSVKVIPYAPDDPLGVDFTTVTMKTFDKIMNNIGKDNDGLGSLWSPLERVAHKFHMNDVWDTVKLVYDKMTPPNDAVCHCLLNAKENGIYDAVNWVSQHYDSGTPITLLNRPIPKLTDAETWAIWRERLLWYYNPRNLQDAAQYIYCATKDF